MTPCSHQGRSCLSLQWVSDRPGAEGWRGAGSPDPSQPLLPVPTNTQDWNFPLTQELEGGFAAASGGRLDHAAPVSVGVRLGLLMLPCRCAAPGGTAAHPPAGRPSETLCLQGVVDTEHLTPAEVSVHPAWPRESLAGGRHQLFANGINGGETTPAPAQERRALPSRCPSRQSLRVSPAQVLLRESCRRCQLACAGLQEEASPSRRWHPTWASGTIRGLQTRDPGPRGALKDPSSPATVTGQRALILSP